MAARGPAPRIQTVTSTTLLEGLKDPANHTRWRDYVDRYRPLLVGFLRRHGVQATDAEDVAQNVLIEFVRSYCEGRYDRERGRLSSWLFGIAFRQLQNHRRRERGRARRADERPVEEVAPLLEAPEELQRAWDEEWEQAVLAQCLAEVRGEVAEKTYRAFVAFALEGRPAADVCGELEMTENAVFGAKRRVLERIRELLPLLRDSW